MDIGRLRQRVSLDNPGTPIEEDDGGFSSEPVRFASRVAASVEPATAQRIERSFANTVSSLASHLVTMRFLPGVTTKTKLTFHDGGIDRLMDITGVSDPEERHEQLVLACTEIV